MYFLTNASLILFIAMIGWLLLTLISWIVAVFKKEKREEVANGAVIITLTTLIPIFIITSGLANANDITVITKEKIKHHYIGDIYESPLLINEEFMLIQNGELKTDYTFNYRGEEISIETHITANIDTKKIPDKVLYKYFNPKLSNVFVTAEKFLLFSIIENEFKQLTNNNNISADIKEIKPLMKELSKLLEQKYGIENRIEVRSISVLTYKK